MAIGVDEKDDGTRILLKLRGEEFLHTINLELLEASGGSITKNIKLEQYPSPASSGFGSGCCLLIFVIMALYAITKTARMLATPEGRLEFRGYKPARTLECPTCGEVVAQHQLLKHLVEVHDLSLIHI